MTCKNWSQIYLENARDKTLSGNKKEEQKEARNSETKQFYPKVTRARGNHKNSSKLELGGAAAAMKKKMMM